MSPVDQIAALDRAVVSYEGIVQTLSQAFPRPAFVPLARAVQSLASGTRRRIGPYLSLPIARLSIYAACWAQRPYFSAADICTKPTHCVE